MTSRLHRSFNSTRVTDGWYDPLRKELEVQFTDGVYFTYRAVPRWVWDDFVACASPGKYINEILTKSYMG